MILIFQKNSYECFLNIKVHNKVVNGQRILSSDVYLLLHSALRVLELFLSPNLLLYLKDASTNPRACLKMFVTDDLSQQYTSEACSLEFSLRVISDVVADSEAAAKIIAFPTDTRLQTYKVGHQLLFKCYLRKMDIVDQDIGSWSISNTVLATGC